RIGIDGEGVIFPFSLVKGLGSALRQDWSLTMTLLDYKGRVGAVDIRPGDCSKRRFGIAVDIGTTTLVVYLVDMASGRVIGTSSSYNAQVKCGDDVISRIVYTEREGGLEHINSLVIDNINGLIGQVTRDHQVDPSDIELMVAAGNTTMMHLFFAVDPKYIREEPYIPTANLFPHVRAGDLGIKINEDAVVYAVPGVASYVGGDITSGILASGLYKSRDLSLFIDIGTNGEIVLGNEEWLMTTACSAGPCFEGGGVRNGMRATEGAIEEVIIDPDNYDVKLGVIGNTRPIGICGSGMIDAVAEMFLTGVIDQRGKIQQDVNSDRVRGGEGGPEFVLAWGNESGTGKEIALTEPDLDNIIRAKGAIYAGFSILLKEAGIDFSAIEKIMIAGGFGKYINVKRAIMIGLLPDLPPEKFVFLGNTSIAGAYLTLISREMLSRAEEIAKKMTYIELSVSRSFMDEYVSALFLPHTDIA
ncbi:MAG: ASKHA domain-containing protein, partial [Nitrospirota bacterium]